VQATPADVQKALGAVAAGLPTAHLQAAAAGVQDADMHDAVALVATTAAPAAAAPAEGAAAAAPAIKEAAHAAGSEVVKAEPGLQSTAAQQQQQLAVLMAVEAQQPNAPGDEQQQDQDQEHAAVSWVWGGQLLLLLLLLALWLLCSCGCSGWLHRVAFLAESAGCMCPLYASSCIYKCCFLLLYSLLHVLLLLQGEAARPAEADEVALLGDEQLAGLSQQELLAHIHAVQDELCGKV
jgi:hypothetical protein